MNTDISKSWDSVRAAYDAARSAEAQARSDAEVDRATHEASMAFEALMAVAAPDIQAVACKLRASLAHYVDAVPADEALVAIGDLERLAA